MNLAWRLKELERSIDALASGSAPSFAEYHGRELDFCRDLFLDAEGRPKQYWAAPRAIFAALNKTRRVTIRSCRKGSKTETFADLILAFVESGPTIVVSTAAGGRQVETGLWSRVNAQFIRTRRPMLGECMNTMLRVAPDWYAIGFSTNDSTKFQGFHAGVAPPLDPAMLDVPDDGPVAPEVVVDAIERAAAEVSKRSSVKRLLLVFDEAAGIEQMIFDAAKGSMLGDRTYVVMGANPTREFEDDHEFCRSHHAGSGYHRIKITAPEDPGEDPDPVDADETFVVPKWLATRADFARLYPKGTPLFGPHARGRFADGDTSGRVIEYAFLRGAAIPCDTNLARGPHVGLDTAAQGGDANVASLFVDGVKVSESEWHSPDTIASWEHIKRLRTHWVAQIERDIPWANFHIDAAPIAKGIIDIAKREGCEMDCVDFGGSPRRSYRSLTGDIDFHNMRAEMYWTMRELLRTKRACIPAKYAASWKELAAHTYKYRGGTTCVVVDPKEHVKKALGGKSPDHADADVLAFCVTPRVQIYRAG